MQLNADQQAAVDCDGHCLVVACPGSGKTRVIVIKIAALLRKHEKSRVCAVTFTRDAAQELKHRLLQDIDSETVNRRTRVGTFHSLAIRQLRHHNAVGKVATPAEQLLFVQRAMAATAWEGSFEEAAQLIELVKASTSTVIEQDSDLYQAYARMLQRSSVADLYDVLQQSVRLMQSGEVSPYPVEYMLVDEFQDTDEVQLAWVMEHVKAGTRVTVVGDDDQSVYSFRRALGYDGMERFRASTDATRITLATNYRSRSEILDAASVLISHNTERIDKALNAARGTGGSVSSLQQPTRDHEAEAIVKHVWSDVEPLRGDQWFQYTVPAGRWAVIARNRRTLDCIQEALHTRRIRYLRPPSESIWTRTPYVQFVGLMQSVQTGDSAGVEQALSFAGIEHDQIEVITESTGGKLFRLLDGEIPSCQELPADATKKMKDFCSQAKGWRTQVTRGNYDLAITGIACWIGERISSPDDRELFERLSSNVKKLSGSLAQRANALSTPRPSGDSDEEKNGVALMTMHGSKGLEFDNVWIIAAEDGVIPSPKNTVYDEERRLMYVGMTRAKDQLYLSSRVTALPSPFVIEAGLDPRA